jgi:N-acyl-D-amino-acid deacylase
LLLLLGVLFLTDQPQAQGPLRKEDFPITGKAGPGLEGIDELVIKIMNRHGIPGAAMALAKDGRLVYAKGFGWADLAGEPATPNTLFGLASVSKPITALAILKLIEEGKLRLTDRVFEILNHLRAARGAKMDPRLKSITVRHLLNHTGGWSREAHGDPINWSAQISRIIGVPQPLTPEQFITYIMGLPLDSDPGTKHEYSNVGYIILGQIIEKVSGQSYEDYVRKHVWEAAGARRAGINTVKRYLAGEARRYLAGTEQMLLPLQLPMVRAAGGWSASPVAMVQLLTALDGSRGTPLLKKEIVKEMLTPPGPPVKNHPNGMFPGLGFEFVYVGKNGYGYVQDGLWNGMRTFMKRAPQGVNWMLAFNASFQPDLLDRQIVGKSLQELKVMVDNIKKHPQVNFFDEFK